MTDWDKLYKGFAGDDLVRMAAADILNRIEAANLKLVQLKALENKAMTSIDDVQARANETLAAVRADTAIDTAVAKVVDAQNATIQEIRTQLQDAINAGVDPTKVQTLSDTLDAILSADTSNSKIVAD